MIVEILGLIFELILVISVSTWILYSFFSGAGKSFTNKPDNESGDGPYEQ